MKPKYSSGYLTPQANRKKIKSRPSELTKESKIAPDINDSLFEKLMSCPIKRQLVINLISSEQDNIREYKRKQVEEQKRKDYNGSPLSKIQKKYKCESPTALLRRRALEQQGRQSSTSGSESGESRANSRQSSATSCPSPVSFDKLLKGVIAYVEVKSKDRDRSSGAKALMRSMGAAVRDEFTKDVTHVVFKDGSFTTYQKAKLMRIHLVSVLWIEAVRSTGTRVSEKKFPALGTEAYDHNVSSICSQMQKDYEEIIRDEVRLSLAKGTPLPSTKSLIDRRRTIMSPFRSTSRLSQALPSSQDWEVDQIINRRKTCNFGKTTPHSIRLTPELTSDDDSDLGPVVNGIFVKRKKDLIVPLVNNIPTTKICNSDMDLTTLNRSLIVDETAIDSTKENDSPNVSEIYNKKTPKLRSKNGFQDRTPKRTEDNLFNIPDESLYRRRTEQLKHGANHSSDNSANRTSRGSSDNISCDIAAQTSGLEIFSKNACITKHDEDDRTTSLSAMQLSTGKQIHPEKSSSTNMSSLRVSNNSCNVGDDGQNSKPNKIPEKSTSTNMSALYISSDSSRNKTNSNNEEGENHNLQENRIENKTKKNPQLSKVLQDRFSTSASNDSFSPLSTNVIKQVLDVLDETPLSDENVTRRRGRRSVQKTITYNTKKKSILPPDKDVTNTDGNRRNSNGDLLDKSGPSKSTQSLYSDNSCENSTKNKNGTEYCDNKKRTLRERRKTISCENGSDLNSNKTSEKRKTMTPSVNRITSHDSERSSKKRSSEQLSPPKKFKDNISQQRSKVVESGPEPSDNHERTLREKRKTVIQPKKTDEGQQVTKTPSRKSPSTTSDTSRSGKENRKLRKLYNPDDSVKDVVVSDEKEREDKRTEVKKRNSNEGVIIASNNNVVSIAPNVLLTAKAKEFIDRNKIDIQTVLNKELEQPEEEKPRRRARKKKNEDKRVSVNSEEDEQQELAEEFINKKDGKLAKNKKKAGAKSEGKTVKRRQSVRLSQKPRKKLNFNNSTSSSDERDIVALTPLNRRSTLEFQPLSQRSIKRKLKIDKSKQPTIVCTRLHKTEGQVFYQIVKKLGGFTIEEEVTSKTTHLVAGEPKRTINMLRAITMGCWILKHEWLFKSLEEGKWLPEEDFEETDFSPAVQQCRLQRQAFGPAFSMDIFQDCGPIYIARGSIPRCSDLRELVSLCKGKVVTIPRNAEIVVGELVRGEGMKCVKEAWILDSITFNKKMPFKKYIINSGIDSPCV